MPQRTAWIPFEDLRPGHLLVDMLDWGTATVLTAIRPVPELADEEEGVGETLVAVVDVVGSPLGITVVQDYLWAARLIEERA